MTKRKPYSTLYVYEGCAEHGVKIGVCREGGLPGRLAGARCACAHSSQFAQTWQLPNAYQIEQTVISVLSQSDRRSGFGEEWFLVELQEMLAAVGFAMELYSPNRDAPRKYRMVCGHVSEVE